MRKISAHYYLDGLEVLHKYPIITIENGIIVSIECHATLPEIAGLEFYSGILLPLFVDLINVYCREGNLLSHLASPFVADYLTDDTIACQELPMQVQDKVRRVKLNGSDLNIVAEFGLISVVKKINALVERGYFKTAQNGVNYFTSQLSKRYFMSLREVSIGCRGEFLIYSDLLFIQGASFNELKLRRLL